MRLVVILLVLPFVVGSQDCDHRDFNNGATVCVCTADYCDTIDPVEKQPEGSYVLYTSNKRGHRLTKTTGNFGKASGKALTINRLKTYQEIIGFGGAFTDAVGVNLMGLNEKAREHLLRSYFSEDGIEYNMVRVPIGGTDFSTYGYSYLDQDPTFSAENYTLSKEDFELKLPLIKAAERMSNKKLDFLASAWISPKEWKTNNDYAGSGFLKQEYYQAWVDYCLRFLDLYKEQGVEFWGITTGNELSLVLAPFNRIPTVGFTPKNHTKWVRDNLGPTIKNSSYADLKVIALDDQRFLLPILEKQLEDQEFKKYLDGVGIHWYWDMIVPIKWVANFHEKHPDLFLLGTEACRGTFIFEDAVKLGSWDRAEDYATDIIDDLENWLGGWMDWNVALDLTGGPTYINNNVDSPIIVNATNGEFFKQPMFYIMGHFSKFLPKQSIRFDIDKHENLKVIAFQRPDNGTTIVVLNKSNNYVEAFRIYDEDRGEILMDISPRSISTILYW
ncbi:PREDICTED: glucosylceramidase-like [Nicrophorus vespilloides]|uniref:Glucosylceramidase n=1 Tax=Nicrophorus vespilloides TaxID=110193 RepID=A0ABM1MCE4_NICVS|nr:PREDICTED: glucosylceramidase-like [Nicrophorus vespilloides]